LLREHVDADGCSKAVGNIISTPEVTETTVSLGADA